MKNHILLISLLFVISNLFAQVNLITIKYVSQSVETPIKIRSDNFETYFSKNIKVKNISNKNDVELLCKYLFALKMDKSGYYPNIRMKIELKGNNKVKCYYLNSAGIVYLGKSYLLPDPLYDKISKLILAK